MNKMEYSNTTKDYDKFELFSINRKKLHEPTIKKLMESMEKSGFVSTITVSRNKSSNKLDIYDGQHRFEAAKRLGIEVNYTEYIGLSKQDIPNLQILKSWGLDDFLHYGVEANMPDYKYLDKVKTETNLPLTALILMFGGSTYGNKLFKSMKWRAISKNTAWEIIGCLRDFGKRNIPLWKSARFIWGFCLVYNSKAATYDHKRMLRHIDKASMKLTKQASPNDYARNIQELYNHGIAKKNRVQFVQ
tara:strand:- start:75 stop:812 length:738 start_codon:yes stop_codon:yes gene_type:complete